MKIIHSISNFSSSEKTFVTIGVFDGVHFGHQKILKEMVATAKRQGEKSVLLTFFPHPKMILQKEAEIQLINTIDERIALLAKTGLDYLIVHPFDQAFSRLTALEFVRDILVEKLHVSNLIIGYDHHFGKNREGNIDQLSEYSHLFGFEITEISAQDIDKVSVSSTKIRKALAIGDIETANKYLGYPFMFNGIVVNGKHLGGKIGFPTANIHIEETYKLIPKTGVYIVKSNFKNKPLFGMMNIGSRPTVQGTHQTIEVHFFNFKADLYGEEIRVELLHYLREEQKFDSIDALVVQLKADQEISLNYLKNKYSL